MSGSSPMNGATASTTEWLAGSEPLSPIDRVHTEALESSNLVKTTSPSHGW
jgi:hypothetical protein